MDIFNEILLKLESIEYYIALLLFIITVWQLIKRFLVDTKNIVIPKWLDFSITIIIVVLMVYVLYDTFLVISS